MAWIELHQAVWTHRKIFELASLLGIDETYAAAHAIRLWTWALDNAPDGDLSALSDRVIAFGAGWRKKPTDFVEAMVEAGLLDRADHGDDGPRSLLVHDWDEYAGRLLERRQKDADRKRNSRGRPKDVQGTSDGTATGVRRTGPDPTGPDRTGPDRTGPDRTGPEDPPDPPAGGSPQPPAERGARRRTGATARELFGTGTEPPNSRPGQARQLLQTWARRWLTYETDDEWAVYAARMGCPELSPAPPRVVEQAVERARVEYAAVDAARNGRHTLRPPEPSATDPPATAALVGPA